MKNQLILFAVILFLGCKTQNPANVKLDKKFSKKIIDAHKYLISQKKIDDKTLIINSIQRLRSKWFVFELHNEKSELGINQLNDSLYNQDKLYAHKRFPYHVEKLVRNNVESSNKVIIFSSARDEYISAQVFFYRYPVSQFEINGYDYSILYLFKFEDGIIKEVYDVKISS